MTLLEETCDICHLPHKRLNEPELCIANMIAQILIIYGDHKPFRKFHISVEAE